MESLYPRMDERNAATREAVLGAAPERKQWGQLGVDIVGALRARPSGVGTQQQGLSLEAPFPSGMRLGRSCADCWLEGSSSASSRRMGLPLPTSPPACPFWALGLARGSWWSSVAPGMEAGAPAPAEPHL